LNQNQEGKVIIPLFNKKYTSLTLIPSELSNYSEEFNFSLKITTSGEIKGNPSEIINQLLSQINQLKAEIARLGEQKKTISNNFQRGGDGGSCKELKNNLYFGLIGDPEVRCLQEFLRKQGADIYPSGLITGNFFDLTRDAVIRFQEKYALEILKPLALERGTGFVGTLTRAKINQLLDSNF
jgi:peptidoglycan hydrolase-like protein with peptidoglycan-binding domain